MKILSIGLFSERGKKLPFLLGFIIAILPKCPFCVFGYSAVLTMCNGRQIHHYTPNTFYWLPIVLALLLIASLIWNFNKKLSIFALFIALFGTSFVTYAEIIAGSD